MQHGEVKKWKEPDEPIFINSMPNNLVGWLVCWLGWGFFWVFFRGRLGGFLCLGLSVFHLFIFREGRWERRYFVFPLRIYYETIYSKLWIALLQVTRLILAVPCAQKFLETLLKSFRKFTAKRWRCHLLMHNWARLYSKETFFPFFPPILIENINYCFVE